MAEFNFGNSVMGEFERIASEKGWVVDKNAISKEAQTTEELKQKFEEYMNQVGKSIPPAGEEYDSAFQDYLSTVHKTDWLEGKEPQEFEAEPIESQELLQEQMKKELVAKIQAFVHKATGMPVSNPEGTFLGGPDGVWGEMSANAWNKMRQERYVTSEGAQIGEASSDRLPAMNDIHYIFSKPLPPKSPEGEPYGDWIRQMPKPEELVEEMKEEANDMIKPAAIVNELVSLANDLDGLGEKTAAEQVDEQLKIFFKEAVDKLYDVTGETGEQLVEQAHPGGGPTIVPAAEEGGKVETVVEEHKKVVDKATKAPTGKLAQTIEKLIRMANKLEDEGQVEASKMVDKTIEELRGTPPFVDRSSASEAADSEDNKASLKKEAETKYPEFMKIWNSIINDDFIPLSKKIWSGMTYPTVADRQLVNDFASKYKQAGDKGKEIYRLWNIAGHKKLAAYIKFMAELLDLEKQGEGVTYELLNKIFWGSAKAHKHAVWHIKMVQKLYGLANMLAKYKEKKPVKKEKPKGVKENLTSEYVRKLKNLNRLITTHATDIDLILGGKGEIYQLEKWIKNRIYNVIDPNSEHPYMPGGKDVKDLTKWINDLVKAISKKKRASLVQLVKNAEAGAPPFAISGRKPAAPGKARRKAKMDVSVRKLQQLLLGLGINVGKDDGIWGPRTAAGYKALMSKLKKLNPRAYVYEVSSEHPGKKAIQWGTYIAQRFASISGRLPATDMIWFAENVSIPVADLYSGHKYLSYLQNLREEGTLPDVHQEQEIGEAKRLVYDVLKRIAYDEEFRNGLIERSGNPNYVTQLSKILMNLLAQLQGKAGVSGAPGEVRRDERGRRFRLPSQLSPQGGLFEGSINSTDDLRSALRSLPPARILYTVEAFEMYAEQSDPSITTEQYLQKVRSTVAKIFHGTKTFWDQLKREGFNPEEYIEWISRYLANLKSVASKLGATLRRKKRMTPKPSVPEPKPSVATPAPPGGPELPHEAELMGGTQ